MTIYFNSNLAENDFVDFISLLSLKNGSYQNYRVSS